MKEIPLSGKAGAGMSVMVDDEDYSWLSKYKFYLIDDRKRKSRPTNYYAVATGELVYIHHLIMGKAPVGYKIDHIDRNTLNNQRHNLRCVTNSLSLQNRTSRGVSQYRGVSWCKQMRKWEARIRIPRNDEGVGRHPRLGYFATEKEAAHNYDFYANLIYSGEATLNFPDFDYSTFTPKRPIDAVLRSSKELLCSAP